MPDFFFTGGLFGEVSVTLSVVHNMEMDEVIVHSLEFLPRNAIGASYVSFMRNSKQPTNIFDMISYGK